MAVYSEAEWQTLREVAADPEALEETYAEWRRVHEDGIRKLAASGLSAEPVEVRVAELQAWCAARKRPLDGSARVEFVTELLMRRSTHDPHKPQVAQFWRTDR